MWNLEFKIRNNAFNHLSLFFMGFGLAETNLSLYFCLISFLCLESDSKYGFLVPADKWLIGILPKSA